MIRPVGREWNFRRIDEITLLARLGKRRPLVRLAEVDVREERLPGFTLVPMLAVVWLVGAEIEVRLCRAA